MQIKHFLVGGIGTNCYLAWDESDSTNKPAFLIDPAGAADKIKKTIDEEGLDLKYIILTHGHGDHTGGVVEIKRYFPSAQLAVSGAELDLLKNDSMNYSKSINGREFDLEPDVLLNDGDVLEVGSLKLKIITTPGHTKGGISIYVGDVLFSGDTLFARSIGRTDLPTGNYDEIVSSIRNKLFKLPDETVVLPGHEAQTTIGYEKKHNPFV
jgi:glyoxylase-like metal-dependent hydrolase (beta-lactamase superfamily II)